MATSDQPVNHLLIVSAAALFDDAGRVLIQQRPCGGTLPGLWEFPGGKVESGETPVDALIRELDEELGIMVAAADITPLSFVVHPLGDRDLLLLLFGVHRWRGTPAARHATALQWLTPESIDPDVMPPADGPLVMMLRSRDSFPSG